MFQRLTSLFFSDSNTPEGLEEPKLFVSEEEEEDGWLIIDLPGERTRGGVHFSTYLSMSEPLQIQSNPSHYCHCPSDPTSP